MNITVPFQYSIGFAVCPDEAPVEAFNDKWLDTLEEAIELLERAKALFPSQSWHIRASVARAEY